GIRVKILFQSQCLVSPQDNTFQRLAYLCLLPKLMPRRVSPQDNPFRQRIAEVFSEDREGNMTLDDFLDKLLLLSEMSPRDLKAYYTFKINRQSVDFNNNFLCKSDLEKTHEQMEDKVRTVCEKVIDKADLDNDGRLSGGLPARLVVAFLACIHFFGGGFAPPRFTC
uniref:Calcium and integrin binding family member 3 n=1 Tax=Salmo trutta TaxID=8032 RepID=A0A673YDV6_SALTR